MEANKIKLSTVIISIAAIVAVELTAQTLISRNLLVPLTGLGFARLAEIFLLLVIIKLNEKCISAIGLASTQAVSGLKKGVIWAVSFGATAAIALSIIHLAGIAVTGFFQMRLPTDTNSLITFFLIGALVGPIAEEIFFRGILYKFLRRWGVPAAIILSTLLFVLPHFSGPTIPATQFIGGILFAVSFEVEKNLMVPVTIHCLGNLAIFTLAAII